MSNDKVFVGTDGKSRCRWSGGAPGFVSYHDQEWGFPVSSDQRLFEKLCLEGFQAGLSWRMILDKRENFRRAFAGFEIEAVARFTPRRVERLLQDEGIVRHRGKIEAAVNNARRALELVAERGSVAAYVWSFEPDPKARPKKLGGAELAKITTSPEATAMSKDLKRRGWGFVGPTTVYAFFQAMGLVNDHVDGCATRRPAEAARRSFVRP